MSIHQYFLAQLLPPELDKKIIEYKHMVLDRYGCRVGLKSPAHITIVSPFWMEEEKEPVLITAMRQFTNMSPFEMKTNGFSAFPPKTIFIAVHPNDQLDRLKNETDHFFNNHDLFRTVNDTRPFHPHITIATRDLHKKSFQDAWVYFEKKKFEEVWMIRDISLLRHNGNVWEVLFTQSFT